MSEQDPNQALQALASMPKDTLLQTMRAHGELSQACLSRNYTSVDPLPRTAVLFPCSPVQGHPGTPDLARLEA